MRNKVSAVLLTLLLASVALAVPTYTVTDLGPGTAYGINNQGDVTMVDLSGNAYVLPGGATPKLLNRTSYSPLAINGRGHVIGTPDRARAWLWLGGAFVDFLYPDFTYTSVATAMNDADQSVGYVRSDFGNFPALWSADGACTVFGELPTLGVAGGLNDQGDVVGTFYQYDDWTETYAYRMFSWRAGALADLGAGQAYDINNAGQIVAVVNGTTPPVIMQNGTQTSLGTTKFTPIRMNNSGVVIGTAYAVPVISDLTNGTFDIRTLIAADDASGITVYAVHDINDAGEMVGYGYSTLGRRAIVLRPAEVTPADTTPPVISGLNVDPAMLWPPENDLRTVNVAYTVTDDQDKAPTARIASITCAQASFDALSDAMIVSDHQVLVRASRDARLKIGRVYTITVEASDVAGNASTATVNVLVPQNAR